MHQQIEPSRRQFLARSSALLLGGLAAGSGRAEKPVEPVTIDDWIKKQAEEAPIAMQFRGTTMEECRKWQAEFAAKLRSLLGPHAPPGKWKTMTAASTDLEDHR